MVMLRDVASCCWTRGNLICHVALPANLPRFVCLYSFLHNFRGSFWGPSSVQNGSCVVLLKILRSILSNHIKFAQIGARTEKLWLPEVGASKLFFCVFPTKIPAKREMLPANQELHVIAGVAVFLKVPNLWINLQRVGKTLRMKAAIWKEKRVRFSACFSYFR
jgi:hypothetical protein